MDFKLFEFGNFLICKRSYPAPKIHSLSQNPMRMQSKEKELVPGTEEPDIKIATPLSRLQVSLIQESLRETGWKHSDHFVGATSPGGHRPQYKMTVFQAKAGLKRSEVVQKLQGIVGKFKEEKHNRE